MIRNPFEVIISYFQLTVTGSHTMTVSNLDFLRAKHKFAERVNISNSLFDGDGGISVWVSSEII